MWGGDFEHVEYKSDMFGNYSCIGILVILKKFKKMSMRFSERSQGKIVHFWKYVA